MRLRNKKTGKIVEWFNNTDGIFPDTLAKLNEEWEDYEEPKEYWCVDYITSGVDNLEYDKKDPEMDNFNKEIGNCFETKKEAEKAVEKLKAWKRLKDKGFKFDRYTEGKIDFSLDKEYSEYTYDGYDEGCEFYVNNEVECDLDLLFGGKE